MWIYLLRLEWLGRYMYFASRSCEPQRDGAAIAHRGTLSVSGWAEAVDITGGVAGACSAEVSVHLGRDALALLMEGHQIDTAWAEVAIWREGQPYDDRVVLVYGPCEGKGIPLPGEALAFTVGQGVPETSGVWPPADAYANTETWPDLPLGPEGTAYPFPVGALGRYLRRDGIVANTTAYRLYMLDLTVGAEIGLIAGARVGATEVTIYNATYEEPATFSLTEQRDALGRLCTVVDMSTAPSGWFAVASPGDIPPDELYVTELIGGVLRQVGTGAIRGLGDALLFFLLQVYGDQGQVAVDVSAWMAALGYLNQWEVGFVTVPGDDPWTIIQDKLLPLAPSVSIVGGPRGVRPVIFAPVEPGRCRLLTVGAELLRNDEPPDYVQVTPLNSIAINFAQRTRETGFRGHTIVDQRYSEDAAAGYSRLRRTAAVTVDMDSTYHRGTAERAALDALMLRWTRPIALSYDSPAEIATKLRLGERFRLADEDLGLNERAVWLDAREATEDPDIWTLIFFGLW